MGPIIITAHDYKYFTGGCHVPMGCKQYYESCQKCPMANNWLGQKIIRSNFQRNNFLLKKIRPIVTAPSTYTNNKIQCMHPYLKVTTIGNTIGKLFEDNLGNFEKFLKWRIKNNNIPTIITVGINKSKRQNKGQDILKNIFFKLRDMDIKFNYISIGKYEHYEGIFNRIHYDSLSPIELKDLYTKSDLCLVTSRYETFSQVTLESILCGTPVIAFNNTGPNDIIVNEKTGLLIDFLDEHSYLNAVINNLNFKFDNKEDFKSFTNETALIFSSEKIKKLFNKIYNESLVDYVSQNI
jgi:glycosyltransferase involved in cell wall biosynthesis